MHKYDLGDLREMEDDEIVGSIIEKILDTKNIPGHYVYHGSAGNLKILERIKKTGTDRCTEEWRNGVISLQEEYLDGDMRLSLEEARKLTDPSCIWAMGCNELEEAVEISRRKAQVLSIVSASKPPNISFLIKFKTSLGMGLSFQY